MTRPHRWILSVLAPLAVALAQTSVLSAQAAAPDPLRLEADLGLVNTAGNSEVTTLNAGEKLTGTHQRFTFTQRFAVIYGRTGDSTITNQWKTSLRLDYGFTARLGTFVRGGFERNTTAGIARRFEESAGLKAVVLERDRTTLESELGAAINQQTSTTDVTQNFASGRAAVLFRQYVTEVAFLTEDLEVLPNLDDTDDVRVNSETSLTAPISSRISVKLTYTVKFDNVPQPGFEKTDRIFSAGIQLVF